MLELIWGDVALLVGASVIAVLDCDIRWRSFRLGRPVYGLLVVAGLLALLAFVRQQGYVPLPGYVVALFALAYLPFLSPAFVDLETTDVRARNELETLLLTRDFAQLVRASEEVVLRSGRRRLRMHWEGREEDGTLVLELDVHPSLLPVTVSRPHVAMVRDQRHLETIRKDVRRTRPGGPPAAAHMSPPPPDGRKS